MNTLNVNSIPKYVGFDEVNVRPTYRFGELALGVSTFFDPFILQDINGRKKASRGMRAPFKSC